MVDAIVQMVSGIPAIYAVSLLAMLPVVELRAALPVALEVYQFSIPKALLITIAANMVPAFLILYIWEWFIGLVGRYWPWLHTILRRIEEKTKGSWQKKIDAYGPLALAIFVAIPLPGSGVWTGALAAWIFGLKRSKALWAIFIGLILSAIAVLIITLSAGSVIRYLIS